MSEENIVEGADDDKVLSGDLHHTGGVQRNKTLVRPGSSAASGRHP